jgi:hypothetical protein
MKDRLLGMSIKVENYMNTHPLVKIGSVIAIGAGVMAGLQACESAERGEGGSPFGNNPTTSEHTAIPPTQSLTEIAPTSEPATIVSQEYMPQDQCLAVTDDNNKPVIAEAFQAFQKIQKQFKPDATFSAWCDESTDQLGGKYITPFFEVSENGKVTENVVIGKSDGTMAAVELKPVEVVAPNKKTYLTLSQENDTETGAPLAIARPFIWVEADLYELTGMTPDQLAALPVHFNGFGGIIDDNAPTYKGPFLGGGKGLFDITKPTVTEVATNEPTATLTETATATNTETATAAPTKTEIPHLPKTGSEHAFLPEYPAAFRNEYFGEYEGIKIRIDLGESAEVADPAIPGNAQPPMESVTMTPDAVNAVAGAWLNSCYYRYTKYQGYTGSFEDYVQGLKANPDFGWVQVMVMEKEANGEYNYVPKMVDPREGLSVLQTTEMDKMPITVVDGFYRNVDGRGRYFYVSNRYNDSRNGWKAYRASFANNHPAFNYIWSSIQESIDYFAARDECFATGYTATGVCGMNVVPDSTTLNSWWQPLIDLVIKSGKGTGPEPITVP